MWFNRSDLIDLIDLDHKPKPSKAPGCQRASRVCWVRKLSRKWRSEWWRLSHCPPPLHSPQRFRSDESVGGWLVDLLDLWLGISKAGNPGWWRDTEKEEEGWVTLMEGEREREAGRKRERERCSHSKTTASDWSWCDASYNCLWDYYGLYELRADWTQPPLRSRHSQVTPSSGEMFNQPPQWRWWWWDWQHNHKFEWRETTKNYCNCHSWQQYTPKHNWNVLFSY